MAVKPTLCTPEAIAIICKHVAEGLPKRHAYVFAGVAERTAKEWLQRGNEGEEPFATFAAAMAVARAEHIQLRVGRIQRYGAEANQGAGDWKAEAYLLERLEPNDFAPRNKTEITGADGGPLQTAATVVVVPQTAATDAEFAALVAAAVKPTGNG